MTGGARTARLVLVLRDGTLVGSLPAVPVASPWWADVEPVVRAVYDTYGIEVTVLRLLEATSEPPSGGQVTYLAEVAQPVPAEEWEGVLDEQPLRQSFARPGGPAADLAWARTVLLEHGIRLAGPAIQVKTWNLSSLWRIPVERQTVWLKVVPPFLAHEGPLLARLTGERVPTLLGERDGRSLLAEIPGEDLSQPELPVLLDMVTLLVDLQRGWETRTDELLALGLPDWRAATLGPLVADVFERTAGELAEGDRSTLKHFVRTLPERFAQAAGCGLPDTLVHGDFWPGNVRGDERSLTLLDWGDSGVGHPLLDQPAFLDRIPASSVNIVREHWLKRCRVAWPGSDPARASALLGPVASARQAVVYQHFLDCIEPAERVYHRSDPAERLQRTAALMREDLDAGDECLGGAFVPGD